MAKRIVILGAGESGAGAAVLYGDALREARIECGVGTVHYPGSGSRGDNNYGVEAGDRRGTRLNSSNDQNSYAVSCLKKKKKKYK